MLHNKPISRDFKDGLGNHKYLGHFLNPGKLYLSRFYVDGNDYLTAEGISTNPTQNPTTIRSHLG